MGIDEVGITKVGIDKVGINQTGPQVHFWRLKVTLLGQLSVMGDHWGFTFGSQKWT